MKSDRDYLLNLIGVICSAISVFVSTYLLTKDGYARDAEIYVPKLIGDGIWLLLILGVIGVIVFLYIHKIKNLKLFRLISISLCIIVSLFCIFIASGYFITYNSAKINKEAKLSAYTVLNIKY